MSRRDPDHDFRAEDRLDAAERFLAQRKAEYELECEIAADERKHGGDPARAEHFPLTLEEADACGGGKALCEAKRIQRWDDEARNDDDPWRVSTYEP